MRWQPFAVAAALAAPPVVLLAAVWPSSAEPDGGGATGDPEAELVAGDSDDSATNGVSSTDYLVTGEGRLRIDVNGPGFDPTLTLVDPESGEQLDFNDDADGLNPSLEIDLGDGGSVLAQVRSLGGPPGGTFTISVEQVDGAGDESAVTTVVAGDGTEAFTAPIGDEPIVVDGPGGVTVTLREDGPNVCMQTDGPDGGSGTCGASLADLAQPGGFTISGDGRTSTIQIATLVGPEVASAVVVFADDTERPLDLVAIPGRVEQVVIGSVRLAGDLSADPDALGLAVELRDANGDALDRYPF